jgi:hypothetical protein
VPRRYLRTPAPLAGLTGHEAKQVMSRARMIDKARTALRTIPRERRKHTRATARLLARYEAVLEIRNWAQILTIAANSVIDQDPKTTVEYQMACTLDDLYVNAIEHMDKAGELVAETLYASADVHTVAAGKKLRKAERLWRPWRIALDALKKEFGG